MSDDKHGEKKPDPVDDLKKGLGLLFRAAKTAVKELPTDRLEKVVVSGVKEVGRAIENVTDQIDRQVFHGKGTIPHPEDRTEQPAAETDTQVANAKPAGDAPEKAADDAKKDAPPEEPPRGPRVA